jgi:hypothetical protein
MTRFLAPRLRPTRKHQRGNARQIGTQLDLRKLGDTALVVEHDEEWRRGAAAGKSRPLNAVHCP